MRPAFLALALPCACAYVDPDPGWADRKAAAGPVAAFASPTPDLRGIDPPASADRVEKGDRILYGVAFEKGGTKRSWLVHVEVEDPRFEPRPTRYGTILYMLRMSVRVCDETGAEVGRDLITVSRRDLVFGLFRACRGDEPEDATGDAPLLWRIPVDVRGDLALRNMLHVVRESAVLYDILWTVLDKPSVFSVIGNLGVRVSVHEDFAKAQQLAPLTIAGQTFAAYELPVELQLNGRPALRSKVVVAEPASPLNLSAGILRLDAFQPSDPTARVSIRVLAARRAADDPK